MFHDQELKAWRENKDALHAELDAAGVPKFEDEKCRIAARVRWLLHRWREVFEPFDYTGKPSEVQQAAAWMEVYEVLFAAGVYQWEGQGYGEGFVHRAAAFIRYLSQEVERLKAAIAEHHAQKADDRCWEDDDRLYAAFGLQPPDRRVGDPEAMLENCKRFIKQRCEGGGPWKSYAELEAENAELKAKLAAAERTDFGL